MTISLGQLDTLVTFLKDNENVSKHFDLSNARDLLHDITDKERRYIYALIFNKKYFDLNKKLIQLNFKQLCQN